MDEFYKNLLKYIGEDLGRDGLKRTPERAANAFAYLTKGYKEDIAQVVNNAIFDSDNDEMIIVKDIEIYSLCEHHLLPFFGKCHVGYLPNGKIIGLSIAILIAKHPIRPYIQTRRQSTLGNISPNTDSVKIFPGRDHRLPHAPGAETPNIFRGPDPLDFSRP